MNFGDVTDEATSFQIMDQAIDSGINFFDTADVYGGPQKPDIEKGYGVSEEIIGRWFSQGGHRSHCPGHEDLSADGTRPQRPTPLGLSHSQGRRRETAPVADLSYRIYQMHHIDRQTPWEEIWQAMGILVQQGKVLYAGSANFAGWDIATAQSAAKSAIRWV